MNEKIKVGIIGPGNIGSDLMYKVMRSRNLEMKMMAGIVDSEGIRRAKGLGFATSLDGVHAVCQDPEIRIVFDATSAKVHLYDAPLLKKAGKIVFDMTPAAVGPYVVPCANLDQLIGMNTDNFNMITCGGQATIPIVYAVNFAADVSYAEIVSCISSKSAGPGTRANIDEFTETTRAGLEKIGGADQAKAIIILNPAEPPLMMTNTIYCRVRHPEKRSEIEQSILDMIDYVKSYVPGYKLRVPPQFDQDKITLIIEVEGAGDFLPKYSGNLDIINCAAVAAAERIADKLLKEG